jgi:sugar phosphate isomerase/epimerase
MLRHRFALDRRAALKALAAIGGGAALGLGGAGAAVAAVQPAGQDAAAPRRRNLKLGFDNFSIRDLRWKAPRVLQHAAELKVDVLLYSDLYVLESHEDKYLSELRQKAADQGIEIHAGTGGICPTSRRVNKDFGSPEEHLKLVIRVAKALGSPVARCYLGSADDRRDGGIERHIASTVEVFQKVRGFAIDHGVKIAIENHAGDTQGRELAGLIEAAGKDYVGCTIDSGNATWALEDPLDNLAALGPYAVSSGIRDSMVWEYEDGAMVQWTAMGDGVVDLPRYFDLWEKLCPKTPVILEIISGFARPFPYLKREFWGPYSKVLASDLAAFAALAKKGKPMPSFKASEGANREEASRQYQLDELARSVKHCKEVLGIGLKA